MESKDNFEIEVHPIKPPTPEPKVEKKSKRGQSDFYVGPEEKPYDPEPATNNSFEIIPK